MFKKGFISVACITAALSGQALSAAEFTEHDAKRVIYDLSQAVTCANVESPEEFHAVKVIDNEDDLIGQYGERFAVVWYGDLYCGGGSGSSTWQLSFVDIGVGSSPYVDLQSPPVRLLYLDVFDVSLNNEDELIVEGERYDPREGSGNQDFVRKKTAISVNGEVLEEIVFIGGEAYQESEFDLF